MSLWCKQFCLGLVIFCLSCSFSSSVLRDNLRNRPKISEMNFAERLRYLSSMIGADECDIKELFGEENSFVLEVALILEKDKNFESIKEMNNFDPSMAPSFLRTRDSQGKSLFSLVLESKKKNFTEKKDIVKSLLNFWKSWIENMENIFSLEKFEYFLNQKRKNVKAILTSFDNTRGLIANFATFGMLDELEKIIEIEIYFRNEFENVLDKIYSNERDRINMLKENALTTLYGDDESKVDPGHKFKSDKIFYEYDDNMEKANNCKSNILSSKNNYFNRYSDLLNRCLSFSISTKGNKIEKNNDIEIWDNEMKKILTGNADESEHLVFSNLICEGCEEFVKVSPVFLALLDRKSERNLLKSMCKVNDHVLTNRVDNMGNTPSIIAICLGDEDIFNVCKKESAALTNCNNFTMFLALLDRKSERNLLKSMCKVNDHVLTNRVDNMGNTPSIIAICLGDEDIFNICKKESAALTNCNNFTINSYDMIAKKIDVNIEIAKQMIKELTAQSDTNVQRQLLDMAISAWKNKNHLVLDMLIAKGVYLGTKTELVSKKIGLSVINNGEQIITNATKILSIAGVAPLADEMISLPNDILKLFGNILVQAGIPTVSDSLEEINTKIKIKAYRNEHTNAWVEHIPYINPNAEFLKNRIKKEKIKYEIAAEFFRKNVNKYENYEDNDLRKKCFTFVNQQGADMNLFINNFEEQNWYKRSFEKDDNFASRISNDSLTHFIRDGTRRGGGNSYERSILFFPSMIMLTSLLKKGSNVNE